MTTETTSSTETPIGPPDDFRAVVQPIGPRRFDDVVGHEQVVDILRSWTQKDDRRGGLLLCGPDGVGKRTLARLLAKAIWCRAPLKDGSACNSCDNCCNFDERGLLGYVEFDAAENQSDESLRVFLAEVRGDSLVDRRVIVVENVDQFKPTKIDIFLKTLEEAPAETMFILLATEVKRVRPAVRSRCRPLVLKPLSEGAACELTESMARALGLRLNQEVLSLVTFISAGLPGRVADALDRIKGANGITVADALNRFGLDWPDHMIAYWLAVLAGDESRASLRAKVVGSDGAESMRRLRAFLNHLFAHKLSEPKIVVMVDPALSYMKEGAWYELVGKLNENAVSRGMARSELWRVLALASLSGDHENAADAIEAAIAEFGIARSGVSRNILG